MDADYIGEMIHFLKQMGSYSVAAKVAHKYKDEDLLIDIAQEIKGDYVLKDKINNYITDLRS